MKLKKNILTLSLLSSLILTTGIAHANDKKATPPDSYSTVLVSGQGGNYDIKENTIGNDNYKVERNIFVSLVDKPDNHKIIDLIKTTDSKNIISVPVYLGEHVYNIIYSVEDAYNLQIQKHYPKLIQKDKTQITYNGHTTTITQKVIGVNAVKNATLSILSNGVPQMPNKKLFTENTDISKLMYSIQTKLDSEYPDIFHIKDITVQ